MYWLGWFYTWEEFFFNFLFNVLTCKCLIILRWPCAVDGMLKTSYCVTFQLRFTDFSLENHTNCVFDYVEILNGGLPDSPSVGRFCGLNPASSFVSQSNAVRIIFRTDISAASRGFRAVYSFDSEGENIVFLCEVPETTRYQYSIEDPVLLIDMRNI